MYQLPTFATGVAERENSECGKDITWKECFNNPSKLDNRSSIRSPTQPDLKHKLTEHPLWMDSSHNPLCVRQELLLPAAQQHTATVNDSSAAPDVLSPSLIWACCKNKDLQRGTKIHNELQERGLVNKNCADALVTMYAKCGELQKAQRLLDMHRSSYIIPWNALIGGYAREGKGQKALKCFNQMQRKGILPNEVTYSCILKACATIGAIDKGKKFHHEILRQGLLEHDVVLGGALVDMYAKCGALDQAQNVLEKLPYRNIVCWTALIAGYVQNGKGQQALNCFEEMQSEGFCPDEATYVCIFKACGMIGAIDKGKKIHEEISRQGLVDLLIVLGGAIVDMYAKCGALDEARSVLEKLPSRDVVSWNALIAGYAQNGQGQQALDCVEQMQREGIDPSEVTYLYILKSCAATGAFEKGKKVHHEISRKGLLEHHIALSCALVDMYAKCGDLCQAQSILDKLPSRNTACWNALIAGYAQNGQGQQALDCFEQMQREGIFPDDVTYGCILKACAVIGAMEMGNKLHDEISRQGLLEHRNILGGALVDMYAKCGALDQARSVLEKLPSRDIVCWTALIAGYAQEGKGQQALDCFEQMQGEGVLPNELTFCCLLNLCSHLGLVDKGQELFDSMEAMYGLKPDLKIFTCMADLLGRAGHLVKAAEVIQGMPFSPTSAVWHCLLGSCRKWVDASMGIWAFEQAIELDKCDGAAYVLMANIYEVAGMPEKAKDIEAMRIQNKAWKLPGYSSWTDPNIKVHEFSVEDRKNAQSKGNWPSG